MDETADKKAVAADYMQSLRWFARMLWNAIPVAFVISVVAQLLPAFIPALRILLVKELVDSLHAVYGQGAAGFELVVPILAMMVGLHMVGSLLGAVRDHARSLVRERTSWQLQELVLSRAASVRLSLFEDKAFFDRMQRAQWAAIWRGFRTFESALRIVELTITLCTLIALFVTGHWSIPLLLFLGMAPMFLAQMRRGRELYALFHEQTPAQRRAEYLVKLVTDRDAAKEIRLYRMGDYLAGAWEELAQLLRAERFRLTLRQQRFLFGGRLAGIVTAMLALVVLLWRATAGAITLGSFFALAETIARFQMVLGQLMQQMGETFEQMLHLSDLRAFIEMEEEWHEGMVQLPERPLEIRFDSVSFAYPGGEPVLRDVSFALVPGEKLALVGENGAGKTTLVKLLLGLYQPTAGRVLIDGIDMREIDPEQLRRLCAAVFQDFLQYQRTARENIAFGRVEALDDQVRTERAAMAGGADAMVTALTDGYETILGRYFEGGQDLSRGQWQKLAISRAYFREAQLLVFDEPTAALDPRAELEVFQQFRSLSEGRSAVFVSHRMASARVADRILVLDQGLLIEDGTHAELMDKDGQYARLFSLQAQWYRSREDVA